MKQFNFEEIEETVDGLVDAITITPEGLAESRERSANFLVGQAVLTAYLKQVDEELAKRATLRDAIYASTLKNADGGNVTEKKINILADENYSVSRQLHEELEAKREWIRGHIKIFENAHILYRSLSRES